MFNTISNLRRKTDMYGDVHFISFLGATLSRLAYMDDNKFLNSYNQIIGRVIQPKILQGINNVDSNNLGDLIDDQKTAAENLNRDIWPVLLSVWNASNSPFCIALKLPLSPDPP